MYVHSSVKVLDLENNDWLVWLAALGYKGTDNFCEDIDA
jgi:hypothetical protein